MTEKLWLWVGAILTVFSFFGTSLGSFIGPFLVVSQPLAASRDSSRPGYEPILHRDAHFVWLWILGIAFFAALIRNLVTWEGSVIDFAALGFHVVVLGWVTTVIMLNSLRPQWDYRWKVLRLFDPNVPGTRKFEAKRAASAE